MSDPYSVLAAVADLYNTYPFPPEPLLNDPPPGYNWRWSWLASYSYYTGRKPPRLDIRILDAGCGTGVGTEYLIHLNPQASVVAIDIGEKALEIARKRCQTSGVAQGRLVDFQRLKVEEAIALPGEFELINCVGVLHHLGDPVAGIQALASKLAPGGLLHIFVYGELGRWEIRLMQQAIALLQGDRRGDYRDGVQLGRELFAVLPENNRLVRREKERWSLDNQRDEAFADMYVHPQEIDYTIPTLFELIAASGLKFLGFSNPRTWQLQRLLGQSPTLIDKAAKLSEMERYRLIELLDPEAITHYEFFLTKPPLPISDWSSDRQLLAALPERNPCLTGWPSQHLFNYDYEVIQLSEAELQFLQACDRPSPTTTVGDLLEQISLSLEQVRSLKQRQLLILAPPASP
ncbi:MAG: class I SAM-dependent methyltransferase [Chloroflexaceae bacterium]|nr:class I SAM-dependent methyltransferase [Chloroflexaceae bacterium]